ncbi:MAG: adenylosuccinate lyase [Phycisphaeraceae bacterium]|nr:adenylosuccinate lyase [Phycisphaeraceae bacterium]
MNDPQRYQSALGSRNASAAMQAIWSPQRKFATWRRLWLALAEAEKELGLPISDTQIAQLKAHLDDVDFDRAAYHEKRLRHDVMAHIHTLGEQAPDARPIIHLGATSQYVNCNTELLQIRDSLKLIAIKLANAIDLLAKFAAQWRSLPTLGFTHFQPAQPTTVGKRATLWAYDLSLALEEIEYRASSLRFRGAKGTTGTQASFLSLFGGDTPQAHQKCEELDQLVAQKMGWPAERVFVVTGQTYPRSLDGLVAGSLSAAAAAAAKFATDLRLLAHRKEIEEPFEEEQVGSSAMPYKRNPMRCERICGLARFVVGLTAVPFVTASEQWLERTLDDSSTRRLTLPEPCLALDGLLDIVINVAGGLVVYPKRIAANLAAELPFMASEELLMAAVQRGADRQEVHEIIRRHAQAAADQVKTEGGENDLLARLRKEPVFKGVDFTLALDPARFVGRAAQQVDRFISEVVEPIRQRYRNDLGRQVELKV